MNLLAIETATDICGIAYCKDNKCLEIVEEKMPRRHAEQLPVFYNKLKELSKFKLSEIDAIGVSIGPGSFTGLRIGLSYAKGLAYAYSLPIIPVPTLLSFADDKTDIKNKSAIFFSHGNKYYFQHLNSNEYSFNTIEVLELNQAADIKINNSTELLHYNCDNIFQNSNIEVVEVTPSARRICKLAINNYEKWVEKNPFKLTPQYISPFKIGG